MLHEDEMFAPADLDRQEEVVRIVQVALPEHLQRLVDELVDNQAAQVWLQQEGAFHLGVAVGLRLAKLGRQRRTKTKTTRVIWTSEGARSC